MPQELAAAAINTLVAGLMKLAVAATPYEAPPDLPKVYIVPKAEITAKVCNGPCRVKAIFVKDQGIYLSNALRIHTDTFDQSILYHEIIHYLQEESGSFDGEPTCDRWATRELEAYQVQWRYLRSARSPNFFFPPTYRRIAAACKTLK